MSYKFLTTLTIVAGLSLTNNVLANQTPSPTKSQQNQTSLKIGYVSLGYLAAHLPEAQKREAEMQSFAKQLINEIQEKSKDLQSKVSAAEQQLDTLTEAQKKQKQMEFNKLNLAIEELDSQRGPKIEQKYREVMKPLQDRIQEVIAKIAEEHGYTFIFNKDIDNGLPPTVLFAKPELNISDLVLEKLKQEVISLPEPPALGPKPKNAQQASAQNAKSTPQKKNKTVPAKSKK